MGAVFLRPAPRRANFYGLSQRGNGREYFVFLFKFPAFFLFLFSGVLGGLQIGMEKSLFEKVSASKTPPKRKVKPKHTNL
jgi:hypothetical protein